MNYNHVYSILCQEVTTIEVCFEPEGNLYTYKALKEWNLKAGDVVVVDSPYTGLTVVEVAVVHRAPRIDANAPFEYKWAVGKVDVDTYKRLIEREESFKDAMQELERLRQRETVLEGFRASLAEGTEAREAFELILRRYGIVSDNVELDFDKAL